MRLLPPSASRLERGLDTATARLSDVTAPFGPLWNPATCPAPLLPWLAWAISVDQWDADWPEARKRAVIAASITVHKQKGTVSALTGAIAALGFAITVEEWFQRVPPGPPYTFAAEIIVDQEPIATRALFDSIIATANTAKNVRSHMTGVNIRALSAGSLFVGAAAMCSETITIGAEP